MKKIYNFIIYIQDKKNWNWKGYLSIWGMVLFCWVFVFIDTGGIKGFKNLYNDEIKNFNLHTFLVRTNINHLIDYYPEIDAVKGLYISDCPNKTLGEIAWQFFDNHQWASVSSGYNESSGTVSLTGTGEFLEVPIEGFWINLPFFELKIVFTVKDAFEEQARKFSVDRFMINYIQQDNYSQKMIFNKMCNPVKKSISPFQIK